MWWEMITVGGFGKICELDSILSGDFGKGGLRIVRCWEDSKSENDRAEFRGGFN
jgi:hypothetical protein